jgi:ribonucleotide monophosphatase NagD (HAD superfamily)
MEQAMARMGSDPERTAAVGDRLETDILSARRAGVFSILTLSGATSPAQLAASDVQPDIALQDIQTLVDGWRRILTQ